MSVDMPGFIEKQNNKILHFIRGHVKINIILKLKGREEI